jgi:hypothetical protein
VADGVHARLQPMRTAKASKPATHHAPLLLGRLAE